MDEYTTEHRGSVAYTPIIPLDFYLWTITTGECREILEPRDFGKLAIYPEGAFARDWRMGGDEECGHPEKSKCSGLLKCDDWLVHTKHEAVLGLYRKENLYCLPDRPDSPTSQLFLSEEDSATVARTVNGHALNKTGGTYRGCAKPQVDLPPRASTWIDGSPESKRGASPGT
eukprot:TRINITY_DN63762_c0_g1_i1.p3 TRINITY_DN63762_c0_g1~~TRINITY_DN63762_c0_g1_i1.p3  ORF type:complete len:172 (-),score=26.18 TRINITY_DN63762_c0_g1_i1:409-924(-)